MKKLKAFWKNKWKIIDGIWNTWFPNAYIDSIADKRMKICESNICGYYDKEGRGDNCFVQGSECCLACGCKLKWKQKNLASTCGLETIGKKPLWFSVMTEQEEQEFRNKVNIKND